MSNEKKISVYLRGNNLIDLLREAKQTDRSANSIINIALESYLSKGSIKQWLTANPKATSKQILEYLNGI